MSETFSVLPMVSSEMSSSTDGGMSAGLASHGQGEELLLDDPVTVGDLDGLADQVDADLGQDDLVPADDLEVDVGHHVARRVALDGPGQGQEVLAIHLEREERVEAGLAGHRQLEVAGAHRHRHGVGPVAVDHTGDLARLAQPARSALDPIVRPASASSVTSGMRGLLCGAERGSLALAAARSWPPSGPSDGVPPDTAPTVDGRATMLVEGWRNPGRNAEGHHGCRRPHHGPVPASRPRCMPSPGRGQVEDARSRSGEVLAPEDLRHRGVLEHGIDGVGDELGHRQHLELVEAAV